MDLDETLGRRAARQWGVFSRAQAFDAGATKWAIARRLASGDWFELERRVYRFRGGVASWRQRVSAATLSLGAEGMASHRTAGQLWGLDLPNGAEALIEVTKAIECRKTLLTARVHLTTQALPAPIQRDRINATPLTVTVLDLADVLDPEQLFVAFDSARRKFPAFPRALETELRHRGEGRRGTGSLHQMLSRAARALATDSALEARALFAMRRCGLPDPRSLFEIHDETGRFVAEVDFAWPELRVVVQCDGLKFHLTPRAFEKDLLQRRKLESLGWRVIHVTWAMLATDEWLKDLARLLAAQRAATAR